MILYPLFLKNIIKVNKYLIVVGKHGGYRIASLKKRFLLFFWKTIEVSNPGEDFMRFNERCAAKYPGVTAKIVTKTVVF